MYALIEHRIHHGWEISPDKLLRSRDGAAITTRHYHHVWRRIGTHVPSQVNPFHRGELLV